MPFSYKSLLKEKTVRHKKIGSRYAVMFTVQRTMHGAEYTF